MGLVVAAEDQRLGRPVALKLLHPDVHDPVGGQRLWREARAAAAIRHPSVCQIFDVGEHDGRIFIAMELVEGETLNGRVARGPLPLEEALELTGALLKALGAIHDYGLLHRDLKPANLMVTSHGLKVLDFGLARPALSPEAHDATRPGPPITMAGTIVGTPAYMAPETLEGGEASVASDLFAVGAILYELLAGQPAFKGATWMAVAHAVLHEHPPALAGGPAVAAVDRIVRRALAKAAQGRFSSAQAFASALSEVRPPGAHERVTVRAMRRLIVLPFRALRSDADTELLCTSLPEAVTGTLSALESVVVRSSLVAAKYGATPDPQALASGADVDVALTGTLFRAGEDIRVQAQLVEVPAGTLVTSCTVQSAAGSLFDLHDAVVRHIVDALRVHLTPGESDRLHRDAPASHGAYELFLRGNEMARDRSRIGDAMALYEQCLERDPGFAPGWAQLGRIRWLRSKYSDRDPSDGFRRAREALDRALALNPDLDAAHATAAQLEADSGESLAAMRRLLGRAVLDRAEPRIFAGLVYACRFCGLADESITFHYEARRLDAGVPTSVTQTCFQMGRYLECLETAGDDIGFIGPAALDALGRRDEAIGRLRGRLDQGVPVGGSRLLLVSLLAALEGDADRCLAAARQFDAQGFIGPEATAYLARQLVYVGAANEGLASLAQAVAGGFCHRAWFERDPWLDSVRGTPPFEAVLARARAAEQAAGGVFRAAGGDELLARPAGAGS